MFVYRYIWLAILGLGLLGLMAACTAADVDVVNVTEGVAEETAETAVAQASPTPFPTIEPTFAARIAAERDPNIPDLPFFDNPDPNQCGIPIVWGGSNDRAWLTGIYEDELVQPTVLLYDSHLRMQITAEAPHGTAVTIIMYQQNPVVDYYYVQIDGVDGPNKGWLPAPFLSFDPVS
ncbi:MAG: hypothetical protein R6X32_14230 [Chloroflexota bacterium]